MILRRAKIKKRQKFAMSFFLCLSAVMVVSAIVRLSRISQPVWQTLWQSLEGCIALLMASITAFRSIFVSQGIKERERKRRADPSSWIQRAKQRKARNQGDGWTSDQKLPSIPQATFVKLRKYVQGYQPWTTKAGTSLGSKIDFTERERETEMEDETSLDMSQSTRHDQEEIC